MINIITTQLPNNLLSLKLLFDTTLQVYNRVQIGYITCSIPQNLMFYYLGDPYMDFDS